MKDSLHFIRQLTFPRHHPYCEHDGPWNTSVLEHLPLSRLHALCPQAHRERRIDLSTRDKLKLSVEAATDYCTMFSSRRSLSRPPTERAWVQPDDPVYDFASFMMLFNDIFMKDRYYQNFNMVNDMSTSNVIGFGAQFIAKLCRLPPHTSVRTSNDPSSRLTRGQDVVLKWPKLSTAPMTGAFIESQTIQSITTELCVISHPGLREHRRILDVYGFAWDQQDGFWVCPSDQLSWWSMESLAPSTNVSHAGISWT